MRLVIAALLHILVFLPFTSLAAHNPGTTTEKNSSESPLLKRQKASAIKSYGRLPLCFIQNNGQMDKEVSFYERGTGHATFFTADGVVIALTKINKRPLTPEGIKTLKKLRPEKASTEAVRLSFVGADKNAEITSSAELTGRVNYFRGNDKTKWQSNIPTYGEVTYNNVYKNIDVKFYGTNSNIEHDIIVHPGGDYREVKFAYDGAQELKLNKRGDLEVSLSSGKITEKRPIVYQVVNGKKLFIDGSYMILSNNSYSYKVASFDGTRDLVIDPVIVYSTYLGGNKDDSGGDITVDATGNIYIVGNTSSIDFPKKTPIQGTIRSSTSDVFITKLNASGTALVYSTYLGGTLGDYGNAIAVDASENVYITGETSSSNFPLVSPIQPTKGIGADVFIAKINAAGSAIVYSTYLGGNYTDRGVDIAIDASGAAYVTGEASSTDFPLKNPIPGSLPPGGPYPTDAFVSKINAAGSALVYSTYLGGSSYDVSTGIAVDASGAAYVTGKTSSSDFPTATPLQLSNGTWNAFITKINPAGSALVYSTYLGGTSVDFGEAIAVDSRGAAYVTGSTSSRDFPVVSPIQGYNGSGYDDVFISKVNPAGTNLIYSTYLGGSSVDNSLAIAVDASGNAYITGYTWSTDFTLVNTFQGVYGGGNADAFVTMVNASGTAFKYSSYLGGSNQEYGTGIAVDTLGNTYVTGWTRSLDFPLKSAKQANKKGTVFTKDAFITKIDHSRPPVLTLFTAPDASKVIKGSALGYTITITNTTNKRQCFQYWENVTLPGGRQFPATGELKGPIRLCLNSKAAMVKQLNLNVPVGVPLGKYTLNAFIGAYEFPVNPVLVSEDHFTFDVTAF